MVSNRYSGNRLLTHECRATALMPVYLYDPVLLPQLVVFSFGEIYGNGDVEHHLPEFKHPGFSNPRIIVTKIFIF